jgi:hypothetical protein
MIDPPDAAFGRPVLDHLAQQSPTPESLRRKSPQVCTASSRPRRCVRLARNSVEWEHFDRGSAAFLGEPFRPSGWLVVHDSARLSAPESALRRTVSYDARQQSTRSSPPLRTEGSERWGGRRSRSGSSLRTLRRIQIGASIGQRRGRGFESSHLHSRATRLWRVSSAPFVALAGYPIAFGTLAISTRTPSSWVVHVPTVREGDIGQRLKLSYSLCYHRARGAT